uniref:ETS domain-containing protein n=1 Tax=Caenorhabditis japonica TaxID=281687 RepID=A0A8R1DLB2_CAEJA
MSAMSDAVNNVAITSPEKKSYSPVRSTMVFDTLKMLTRPKETTHYRRRKQDLNFDPNLGSFDNSPSTPLNSTTRWGISCLETPLTDEQLMLRKGPSRLIGFLIDIAMDERARKALRWTGQGLEFILINKELVAKMWGNRKHNTKDMDYYKLSRAIREKYDKKELNSVTKTGKLKKGSRTYSYVFTENSYSDLVSQTGQSIEYIEQFAEKIGNKYRETDIAVSSSPQAPSPQNSE